MKNHYDKPYILNFDKKKEIVIVFALPVSCLYCFERIFHFFNSYSVKFAVVSTSKKTLNSKKRTKEKFQKLSKKKIKILFEEIDVEDDYLNKIKNEGIFEYFKISKTPEIVIHKRDSLIKLDYDVIFDSDNNISQKFKDYFISKNRF